MPSALRRDLLPAICTALPEPEATFVRSMDPDDYLTHLEAYTSVRRTGHPLPHGILHDFVTGLCCYLDAQPA